jgi:hypothetical protein
VDESEKTKFNWHTYEYALSLFENIESSRDKALARWKSRRNEKQIAEFCAYYAKRMKQSTYDRITGKTNKVISEEVYVSDYCHTNTHRENDTITDVARNTWEELMKTCIVCPNRCISERHVRCELFDRMERGGYFC